MKLPETSAPRSPLAALICIKNSQRFSRARRPPPTPIGRAHPGRGRVGERGRSLNAGNGRTRFNKTPTTFHSEEFKSRFVLNGAAAAARKNRRRRRAPNTASGISYRRY
ncbi:hypothetical protein EVAR_47485_1 [Eumeta japonica]|uniref:Uncharacterized protein n=1 Tax=Eumeta variegata TaxID=151549 RepID=A0A4C1XES8_EUMVA|nr:hypothetical protein EVAR_47485_1 [Eumeta japonica]